MADISVAIPTTGSAGTSTGTTTTKALYGAIWGVNFDYRSAPATTDVTVSIVFADGTTVVLLTLTNVNTDGYYAPRMAEHDAAGAATGTKTPFLLTGQQVKIDIAQCDQLTPALNVTLQLLD